MKCISSKSNIEGLYNVYPILREIDEKNSGIIKNTAIFKEVAAEEYIVDENSECVGFVFVLSGSIKVKKINEKGEETNVYNIEKGQYCHEALSCFLNYESLNIIGKAVQNSIICIIPFQVVNKYLMNDILFIKNIYGDLYNKLKIIINAKEEVKHEPIINRLIKLLLNKKSKIIYITHDELAFELDSSREVISRKLKEISKLGYITLERGKIHIEKDLNELIKNYKN